MYLKPRTEQEELEEMHSFEDRHYTGWDEPGNDALDRTPERIDLLTDAMEREDASSFDEDGWVR